MCVTSECWPALNYVPSRPRPCALCPLIELGATGAPSTRKTTIHLSNMAYLLRKSKVDSMEGRGLSWGWLTFGVFRADFEKMCLVLYGFLGDEKLGL